MCLILTFQRNVWWNTLVFHQMFWWNTLVFHRMFGEMFFGILNKYLNKKDTEIIFILGIAIFKMLAHLSASIFTSKSNILQPYRTRDIALQLQ